MKKYVPNSVSNSLVVTAVLWSALLMLSAGCGAKDEDPEVDSLAPAVTDNEDAEPAGDDSETAPIPPVTSSSAQTGGLGEDTSPPPATTPGTEVEPGPELGQPAPGTTPAVEEEALTAEEKAAIEEAKQTVVPKLPRPNVPPVFKSLGKALVRGVEGAAQDSTPPTENE